MLGETVGAGSSSAGPLIECSRFLSHVGHISDNHNHPFIIQVWGLIHHKEYGTIFFLILELLRKFVLQIFHRYYLMLTFLGLGNVKITHASTLARAKGKAKFVGTFFHVKVMIIIH